MVGARRFCTIRMMLLLVVPLFFTLMVSYPYLYQVGNSPTPSWNSLKGNKHYSVLTDGCRIPLLDPFDHTLNGLWEKIGDVPCKSPPALITLDMYTNRITVNRTVLLKHHNTTTNCSFHNFGLVKGNTHKAWHNTTQVELPLNGSVAVTHDFIEVQCNGGKKLYKQQIALIQRKPEMVEEKKALKEKFMTNNKPAEMLDILIIGTDSQSRSNFARHCPNTRDYLLNHLGGIEMLGYNKVGLNTHPNMIVFTTGHNEGEIRKMGYRRGMKLDSPKLKPPIPFIWNKYREKGYAALFSEDWPSDAFLQQRGYNGFMEQPVEFYWRPFSVVAEATKPAPDFCLHGQLIIQYQLDYIKQFLRKHKDVNTFVLNFNSRPAHEGPNNVGRYDSIYKQFVLEMEFDGHLNNTLLVFMGDHGARNWAIRRTYIGMLEDFMPLMTLVFPKWFLKKYPDVTRILNINRQRLATHYDMYSTLESLLSFAGHVSREKTPRRGHSLLGELSEKRSCQNIGIPKQFCSCNEYRPINVTDPHVVSAAVFMINHINSLLKKEERKCHQLSTLRIDTVRQGYHGLTRHGNDVVESGSMVLDYQIALTVLPSNGTFEAILAYNDYDKNFKMIGEPMRTNIYGNQSACIKDAFLKRYCFCKL